MKLSNYLIDTHCHLNDPVFDTDRDLIVQQAGAAGVAEIWDVAVDLDSSRRAIANARQYPNQVKALVGVDPEVLNLGSELTHPRLEELMDDEQELHNFLAETEIELTTLLTNHKDVIVGLGETGIDDYWLKQKLAIGEINPSVHAKLIECQAALFRLHLKLAQKFNLPLSVHSRGAEQLALDISSDYKVTMIMHSFTGSLSVAAAAVNQGHYLGLNAISTFKNAGSLRQMWAEILLELNSNWGINEFYDNHVVFETDAPYLAPDPWRGERNQPAYLDQIYTNFRKNMTQVN